jgi:hypothetical protein
MEGVPDLTLQKRLVMRLLFKGQGFLDEMTFLPYDAWAFLQKHKTYE